ncbi:MAG: ABC transporter ATP-binding protein [Fimbriimonadaceae bacterium]|nr:ABC transporter ATP-binding protein [Fimbriimonadaceae bacterium]
MTDAIEIRDLHVAYRRKDGKAVEAVRGLSLQIQPGEVVGFLGPNGAGKSSTLKALMGFVQPKSGECLVFGEPSWTESSRRRIGYLPEVAMYYPHLTPLETLTLYGELQGLRGASLRHEATELLRLVGLTASLKTLNRQLSKGMLQRVGIAQSLLGSPDLLILDEVTSGLDPLGRQELRTIIQDKQEQGTTVFFSSHELAEVEMLCDRIIVIHQGQLVEERQVSRLKDELRKFTLAYRGDLMGVRALTDATNGVTTASFDSKEDLVAALNQASRDNVEIINVVTQEGSLEDYFIETIREAA